MANSNGEASLLRRLSRMPSESGGLFLAGVLLAIPATGCALAPSESVGAAEQAVLNMNALDPNALNANAHNPNALNPNALSPRALSPNALDPNAVRPHAMHEIQDPGDNGALSRELLSYTVSCAFTPEQSFDFSWTDSGAVLHQESYPGLLGLAPYWATGPLDLAGEQWVSNCLASRVNAEGVHVMLSSRGTNPALATTATERARYRTREAAWFGNLFDAPYTVYACYDPLSMLPSQLAKRICAQPQLITITALDLTTGYSCGPITVAGPCSNVAGLVALGDCQSEDPTDRYFYQCSPPDPTDQVPAITTFLQGSIPW
jgi:hypothetical protein